LDFAFFVNPVLKMLNGNLDLASNQKKISYNSFQKVLVKHGQL